MITVNELLQAATVVAKQKHGNLTLHFIKTPCHCQRDIISFADAVRDNVLTVTEIGDGEVNEVQLHNTGECDIFLPEGHLITGLKQSRAIQSSILIGRRSTIRIPVVCIEKNRWSNPLSFGGSDIRVYSSLMKELKMLRAKGLQDRVWKSIDKKLLRQRINSKTAFVGDFYKAVDSHLTEYGKAFTCPDTVNGLLAIVDGGKPVTVEMNIMANPALFREHFPAMLSGLIVESMDAEELKGKKCLSPEQFMGYVVKAAKESHSSYGQGTEYRFETESLVGSVLCVNDALIYAGAFPNDTV